MTSEEYVIAMNNVALIARIIQSVPLDDLQATLSFAETVGPIFYPTEYRNADTQSQRTLIDATIAFRNAVASVILPPCGMSRHKRQNQTSRSPEDA